MRLAAERAGRAWENANARKLVPAIRGSRALDSRAIANAPATIARQAEEATRKDVPCEKAASFRKGRREGKGSIGLEEGQSASAEQRNIQSRTLADYCLRFLLSLSLFRIDHVSSPPLSLKSSATAYGIIFPQNRIQKPGIVAGVIARLSDRFSRILIRAKLDRAVFFLSPSAC